MLIQPAVVGAVAVIRPLQRLFANGCGSLDATARQVGGTFTCKTNKSNEHTTEPNGHGRYLFTTVAELTDFISMESIKASFHKHDRRQRDALLVKSVNLQCMLSTNKSRTRSKSLVQCNEDDVRMKLERSGKEYAVLKRHLQALEKEVSMSKGQATACQQVLNTKERLWGDELEHQKAQIRVLQKQYLEAMHEVRQVSIARTADESANSVQRRRERPSMPRPRPVSFHGLPSLSHAPELRSMPAHIEDLSRASVMKPAGSRPHTVRRFEGKGPQELVLIRRTSLPHKASLCVDLVGHERTRLSSARLTMASWTGFCWLYMRFMLVLAIAFVSALRLGPRRLFQ